MDYDGNRIKEWAGDSQWRAWKADLARFKKWGYSGWGSEGFWALTLYRVQRSARQAHPRLFWRAIGKGLGILKKVLTLFTHINLDPDSEIGAGCLIPHVGSIRIGDGAKIGADCAIHHVCTIGAGAKPGAAVIGDHVMIGCHTSILGPVRIGSRANIAAQTLVICDVPEGATAVGVPARILPGRWRLDEQPKVETCRAKSIVGDGDLASFAGREPCARPAICSTPSVVQEPVPDVFEALLAHARSDPNRPAITLFEGPGKYRSHTYLELANRAQDALAKLNAYLPHGAPIMLFSRRTPDSIALILAALGSHRPFSCLNPRWRWPQVKNVLSLAGSKVLLVDEVGMEMVGRADKGDMDNVAVVNMGLLVSELDRDVHREVPLSQVRDVTRSSDSKRPGCYLFTSGSTGTPKGVMIATEDLKRRAQTDVVLFGLGPEDVLLNILPISFDVGLNQILAALLAGCETVICQSFLPADILTIAKERHVTGIPSVPSIWQDFLNTGLRFDCIGEHSHLRFVTISGGDMCPTGLGRMREIVGDARIYKTYGQTEAFRTTTLLPDEFALKRTSVGQPYPGVTVAIMRPDGSLASRNETGELVHAGLGVMAGYLGDPEGTAAKLRACPGIPEQSVNFSGDQAFMDPDGYLHLLGREDQMLKIKGNRVYPAEVSNLIHESPGVKDAVAVVAKNVRGEQCLVAFIVPRSADLRACIEKALFARLPGYMSPQAVEFVDSIPRTANGKPDCADLCRTAGRLLAARRGGLGDLENSARSLREKVAETIQSAIDERLLAEPTREPYCLCDILDSLSFLELISIIESRHNLRIDIGKITTADMSSADALAAAVSGVRSEPCHPGQFTHLSDPGVFSTGRE
jgi:acyl-CoA synthetase (AMP-forming)/AMP-acid ligase II/serine acetyltransferase/acyl carrier protein